MRVAQYQALEQYMLSCINDSAHDKEHIYRVLYAALEIAACEENVHLDILVAACLLHDIARDLQKKNPALCHAREGGKMARSFLLQQGWAEEDCIHVQTCIETHRYRSDNPPVTIEAKILFDSDKLDAVGLIGIARTLCYQGNHTEPLYIVENGMVLDSQEGPPSFLREYHFKLKKLYDRFYTAKAREIALSRQKSAVQFHQNLLKEISHSVEYGSLALAAYLK